MNFIAQESPQKLRGCYYTDMDVAKFLAQWATEKKPRSVLEPACGDGVFFEALASVKPRHLDSVVACEINATEARKARHRTTGLNGTPINVFAKDFLEWSIPRLASAPEFDAVLGNPPFIRYQYLSEEMQQRAEQVFSHFDLPFTKHTNAWVPFVISSIAQLRPGGRLAMVVPKEILHIIHARSLRYLLLNQCSKILILDPESIWFDDTLQGVVLLLAEKKERPDTEAGKVGFAALKDRGTALATPARELFEKADFIDGSILDGKWMGLLLTAQERSLLDRLGSHPAVSPFKDIATVDVGIVTGANKFFLVPDSVVEEFELEQWACPMFGRSEHVSGVIYDKKNHEENRRLGHPTNFIWFQEKSISDLPARARAYIRSGEADGLPKRYKCRVRSPWFGVPSVYDAPVGMLKRCHHFPRLVLNKMKAFTTDTAYRVVPKRVDAAQFVFSFVNTLTVINAELKGRHYGGGVLEMVPSEIERLPVPILEMPEGSLAALDQAVKSAIPPEDLLAQQDEVLLRPLGASKRDCVDLLSTWEKLRTRRQRTDSEAASSSSIED